LLFSFFLTVNEKKLYRTGFSLSEDINNIVSIVMKRRKGKSEKKKKRRQRKGQERTKRAHEEEELVFEDPFVDEYEEEDVAPATDAAVKKREEEEDEGGPSDARETWDPMERPLEEGETLNYDSSAYTMFHRLRPEWPSLSVDVIRDNLGARRTKFPLTAFLVTGSQANRGDKNKLTVMKVADMHKTQNDEKDSDDSEDEDGLDDDPTLLTRETPHPGCTNRVRCMPQRPNVVATWADTGKVHIWDVSEALQQLSGKATGRSSAWRPAPVFTFEGHPMEGFAMDWSSRSEGRLITGDCRQHIYLWEPASSSVWSVDKVPFKGHSESVEDLQWSPTEETVFASCSVDRSIRIWDTRCKRKSMLTTADAHETDINVISWNRLVSYLLVSGADDGSFKIWDMRNFKANAPAAHFKWHTGPISSVCWHPSDDSVLAVAAGDDQISVWDMSVEADKDEAEVDFGETRRKVPPQMLFLHHQKDPKEVKFHAQLPGVIVSTGVDGFNIFRPSNL